MKFLPFKSFSITTQLDPGEVEVALQNDISPGNGIFSPVPYFKGYVINGVFVIKPDIVIGRNSFIPEIKGSIFGDLNGSKVVVKMRLFPVVIVFACLILGFIFTFGATALINNSKIGIFKPISFIPFIIMLAIYALAIGIFTQESRKATARLLELLNGTLQ